MGKKIESECGYNSKVMRCSRLVNVSLMNVRLNIVPLEEVIFLRSLARRRWAKG